MKQEIIYRDQRTIDELLRLYSKAVPVLQEAIDELKETGMTLTDEVLSDLASGGYKLRNSVENDIKQELSRFKLAPAKATVKKELETLYPLIDKAAKKIKEQMRYSTSIYVYNLEIESFVCKGLKVGLVNDINTVVTDKNTLYSDDPIIAEAYRQACEIKSKIDDLEALLQKHGDVVHTIGKKGIASYLIEVDSDFFRYEVELNRQAFKSIHATRPKP